MVYPMGIMSGLGSPFASSIRKIAQPIDNGYRGPTQMGLQGVLGGPIPRGGYESVAENRTAPDLTSLLAQQRLQGMKDKFTNIEQGFFNSPEFAEYLQAGKGAGTMDVRFSPYFGLQGSGSIGGAQDAAYEKYLNRTGNIGYLQGGQNFKAAEGYQAPVMGNLKLVEGGVGSFDPRGPNVPGNRPPNPNNSLIDPYARPRPGMLPQPVEINPNYRPDNFRPNPNMYQRPMRRPFGFGGRPMNPFMGMGIGMMNPMGMGMFGGFPMRPPMFGGYGGYGGGYGGYGGSYNMMRPPMGFGLGGANLYGVNPYSNFGRPNPYPQPSYNTSSPYSSGMSFNQPNLMQQQQGGYGSYQQPSGYGNYGGMQNPYQPQQMGNTNNFAGYGQQQAMF